MLPNTDFIDLAYRELTTSFDSNNPSDNFAKAEQYLENFYSICLNAPVLPRFEPQEDALYFLKITYVHRKILNNTDCEHTRLIRDIIQSKIIPSSIQAYFESIKNLPYVLKSNNTTSFLMFNFFDFIKIFKAVEDTKNKNIRFSDTKEKKSFLKSQYKILIEKPKKTDEDLFVVQHIKRSVTFYSSTFRDAAHTILNNIRLARMTKEYQEKSVFWGPDAKRHPITGAYFYRIGQWITQGALIAKGGFGSVFFGTSTDTTKAENPLSRNPVFAYKKGVISETEHKILLQQESTEVVYLKNTPSVKFVQMPFYADGSIAERIEDPIKGLDAEGFYTLAFGMIDSVNDFHKKGYIHRDIKPQNFVLDGQRIHLIDFGLALKMNEQNTLSPEDPLYYGFTPLYTPQNIKDKIKNEEPVTYSKSTDAHLLLNSIIAIANHLLLKDPKSIPQAQHESLILLREKQDLTPSMIAECLKKPIISNQEKRTIEGFLSYIKTYSFDKIDREKIYTHFRRNNMPQIFEEMDSKINKEAEKILRSIPRDFTPEDRKKAIIAISQRVESIKSFIIQNVQKKYTYLPYADYVQLLNLCHNYLLHSHAEYKAFLKTIINITEETEKDIENTFDDSKLMPETFSCYIKDQIHFALSKDGGNKFFGFSAKQQKNLLDFLNQNTNAQAELIRNSITEYLCQTFSWFCLFNQSFIFEDLNLHFNSIQEMTLYAALLEATNPGAFAEFFNHLNKPDINLQELFNHFLNGYTKSTTEPFLPDLWEKSKPAAEKSIRETSQNTQSTQSAQDTPLQPEQPKKPDPAEPPKPPISKIFVFGIGCGSYFKIIFYKLFLKKIYTKISLSPIGLGLLTPFISFLWTYLTNKYNLSENPYKKTITNYVAQAAVLTAGVYIRPVGFKMHAACMVTSGLLHLAAQTASESYYKYFNKKG